MRPGLAAVLLEPQMFWALPVINELTKEREKDRRMYKVTERHNL